MAQLRFSGSALDDIERYIDSTRTWADDEQFAARLATTLNQAFNELAANPSAGRFFNTAFPEYKELIIPLGRRNAYLALFRYDKSTDIVYIAGLKAGREAAYQVIKNNQLN